MIQNDLLLLFIYYKFVHRVHEKRKNIFKKLKKNKNSKNKIQYQVHTSKIH